MKLVVLTDSVFISVSPFLLSCFVFTGHMSTTMSQSVYFERSHKYKFIFKVRVIKFVLCFNSCRYNFLRSVVLVGMAIGFQRGTQTQRHKGATIQPTHTHRNTLLSFSSPPHSSLFPLHQQFFYFSSIVRYGFIPVNARTFFWL